MRSTHETKCVLPNTVDQLPPNITKDSCLGIACLVPALRSSSVPFCPRWAPLFRISHYLGSAGEVASLVLV